MANAPIRGSKRKSAANFAMTDQLDFPSFDVRLPRLNQFILRLVKEYNAAKINSWEDLDKEVKAFFTPQIMNEIEAIVPGWKKMASYMDGITLTHVMCIFMGMYEKPEYLRLTSAQQEEMKWIILFHDIEKAPRPKKRDHLHAFRSAVNTARALPKLGFPITAEYESVIDNWDKYTRSAFINIGNPPIEVPDNSKLPAIFNGIEQMFGHNTPATLIIKTILLHLSVNMEIWPPPNPLTNDDVKDYFNKDLATLLLLMNLGDNDGWTLFNPNTLEHQRIDIMNQFEKIGNIIST
jgi:hypothetical protein